MRTLNRYRTLTRLGRNLHPGDVIIGDRHTSWDTDQLARVDGYPSVTRFRWQDHDDPNPDTRVIGRRMLVVSTSLASNPNDRSPMHWLFADLPYTIRRPY